MTLSDALGVGPGEVVAFIGAGGKTTAMYRVAADLAARGLKVIVTTTTRMLPPGAPHIALVLEDRNAGAVASLAAEALDRWPVVAVAARALADGKLQGVPPAWITVLRGIPGVAAVLVEADGSAGKLFKAPADHEPVIPPETTLLVAMVRADALGQPLVSKLVHRPELAARQAGIRKGDVMTPEAVARVLLGKVNLRDRPPAARLAALITNARAPAMREAVQGLAQFLRTGGASPVVLAELIAEPGFIELVA